ncbi:hypothetical protein GC163_23390 [bacterium]|nr:hypothetical protein [bacterium]
MTSTPLLYRVPSRTMWLWVTTLLVLAGSLCGCQLTPAPGLIACPLPVTEQVQTVLEIVPLGTSRDDALKALDKAGFAGGFGSNQSIYYCDIWDQGKGERWHMNVQLLFDDEGKLYATRPDTTGELDPTPRAGKATLESTSPVDPFADFQ